jgi:hypothetical protein
MNSYLACLVKSRLHMYNRVRDLCDIGLRTRACAAAARAREAEWQLCKPHETSIMYYENQSELIKQVLNVRV